MKIVQQYGQHRNLIEILVTLSLFSHIYEQNIKYTVYN